jgi:hypothetical protein
VVAEEVEVKDAKVDGAVEVEAVLGPEEKMTEPVSVGESVEVRTLVEVTVVWAWLIVTIKAVAKIIDVFAFMPSKRLGIVGVLPKQFIPIRMKFLLMEGA